MNRAASRRNGYKKLSFNWASKFDEKHVVYEGNIFLARQTSRNGCQVVMLVGSVRAQLPLSKQFMDKDLAISYDHRRELRLAKNEDIVMARLTGKLIYV